MSSVSLFSSHHDPHGSPLRDVDRLDDSGNFIHEGDGTCDMVEGLDSSDLFPGHGHIFEELENSVRNVLEGTDVDTLIMSEFF